MYMHREEIGLINYGVFHTMKYHEAMRENELTWNNLQSNSFRGKSIYIYINIYIIIISIYICLLLAYNCITNT